MNRRIFVIVVLLLGILFSNNEIRGQEWNYARLSTLYGGSIPFDFNSIQKYSEGIEILEGTVLGITLADSGQIGHDLEGFDIYISTFNNQGTIKGVASDLPLDRIRVKAENYLGLGGGTSYGYRDLNATSTTIFSYTNIPFSDLTWDTHQLAISYECGLPAIDGGNGSLLGEIPDYYTVEIEIELIPTGAGF